MHQLREKTPQTRGRGVMMMNSFKQMRGFTLLKICFLLSPKRKRGYTELQGYFRMQYLEKCMIHFIQIFILFGLIEDVQCKESVCCVFPLVPQRWAECVDPSVWLDKTAWFYMNPTLKLSSFGHCRLHFINNPDNVASVGGKWCSHNPKLQ